MATKRWNLHRTRQVLQIHDGAQPPLVRRLGRVRYLVGSSWVWLGRDPAVTQCSAWNCSQIVHNQVKGDRGAAARQPSASRFPVLQAKPRDPSTLAGVVRHESQTVLEGNAATWRSCGPIISPLRSSRRGIAAKVAAAPSNGNEENADKNSSRFAYSRRESELGSSGLLRRDGAFY
jgi:hypothetical protein